MKRTVSIIIVVVLLVVFLPGCSIMQKIGLQKSIDDELWPVSSIIIGEAEASKLTDKTPLRLYFANEDNTKLKLEIRYVSSTDVKKSTSNMATAVVNELIKGPSDETTFRRTVPAEARLREPVSISNNVATVDFSKEFKSKHSGGKDAEKMTIYSIVNSLTELDGIEKVKFLIDGTTHKEYMGNFKFDALFPRSTQLISKDAAKTTSGVVDDEIIMEVDGEAEQLKTEIGEPVNSDYKETSGSNGENIDGLEILE
ncbi:MAG: GerMN domain-containing protein [Clostridiaceae bacterium]|nr:GerMN domain-containing protein [Clostridiaceae bacterium]